MTIDRARGLVSVRPLRRRREYIMPLDMVAEMICWRVTRADLAQARREKQDARRARTRKGRV